MDAALEQVSSELTACLRQVSTDSLAQAIGLIEAASRIFVAGAGRSGLCMKAFGMRLMHLGKTVYVVGETTTPAIAATDLLIVGSGSGRTSSLLMAAGEARRQRSKILLFTTDEASPLAGLADRRVVIPAPTYWLADEGRLQTSRQPLGSLFEQSLWLVCDSLVLGLMPRTGVEAAQMAERHTNLE
jgi:6-phospho-3-hexuloisomerase